MKPKTLLMLFSAALAFALVAGHNLGMAAKAGQQTKVTGCLRSGTAPNSYTLTNASGSYDVVPAGKINLRSELGNEVEITGTMTKVGVSSGLRTPVAPGKGSLTRPDKALQNPFASEGSSRAGTGAEIRASSIRRISDTCH